MKKFIIICLMFFSISLIAKPIYVVKLQISQSRFSLSLWQHAKDAMNKCVFTFPTDKETYDKLKIGDNVISKFRTGSFIISGSFSKWKIKVVDKFIKR